MQGLENVCEEKIYKKVFMENNKDFQNYFYYKYGDLDKAKDLLQDAFVKLWNNCKDVSYSKAKGYVFILVKNAFMNDFKREKMKQEHHSTMNKRLFEIESPDYVLEEKEFLDKLNLTLKLLPNKEREVFLLNRIDQKKYREISELLGISVKTVEKRMHNALVFLRDKIGKV